MRIERFSFTELEKQLEGIEFDVEKIEFISNEIVRCRNAIQDVKCEAKNIEPTAIKISAKTTNQDTSIVELVNSNKKIKRIITKKIVKICAKNLCKEYSDFMERTENLLTHLQRKLDAREKWVNSNRNMSFNRKEGKYCKRIIWRYTREKLLELFDVLYQNQMLTKYTSEEILVHFVDEKQKPFCKGVTINEKFRWNDSESSFAVFIDELVLAGAIDVGNKDEVFMMHFVNRYGKPFKNLAQKRNYVKNYSKTGDFMREIIKSVNLTK